LTIQSTFGDDHKTLIIIDLYSIMSVEIIMIRHGESVNNAITSKSMDGERQTDSELSDLGRA